MKDIGEKINRFVDGTEEEQKDEDNIHAVLSKIQKDMVDTMKMIEDSCLADSEIKIFKDKYCSGEDVKSQIKHIKNMTKYINGQIEMWAENFHQFIAKYRAGL